MVRLKIEKAILRSNMAVIAEVIYLLPPWNSPGFIPLNNINLELL